MNTCAIVGVQRHGAVTPAERSPVGTVRAGGHHHAIVEHEQAVLIPYSRDNLPIDVELKPVSTLTTRDSLALVVPRGDQEKRAPVPLTEEDVDACRFRMFALHEIAGAMGLSTRVDGSEYVVKGNKRERMAQYGNAVTPPAMALIVSRLLEVIQAETFMDMFCGCGGSSLGAELVGGRLRMAMNHWPRAIETHSTNFPHADHDCADVSLADPRRYPATDILMASPECTNHSIAKGARRRKPQAASLFDDGPAGDAEQDKSRATMWDVVRFAEAMLTRGKPYKAIIVENVVDAFKWGANDDGQLFAAWLNAMDALGYEHEIVWLNSMFAHVGSIGLVPQSRDRMYPVFWLKGARRPNLRFDVPSWCMRCESVVQGRQIWKRLDSVPWGRYGQQYLYGCTDCARPVIPGALAADAIVDHSLPLQVIGERLKPLKASTRGRIRRGLERVYAEPFAIRLAHGGLPRPTTLPLVTLTTRQEMAMVLPSTTKIDVPLE